MTFPPVSHLALIAALASVSFAAVSAAAPLAITPAAQNGKSGLQQQAELKPKTGKTAEPAKKTDSKKAETKKTEPKKPEAKAAKKAETAKKAEKSAAAKPTPKLGAPAKPLALPKEARADVPVPRPRPTAALRTAAAHDAVAPEAALPAAATATSAPTYAVAAMGPAPVRTPVISTPSVAPSADDVTTVKQALDLIRRGKTDDADDLLKSIDSTVARKLVEWAILRSNDNGASFARYAAFASANPDWPNVGFLRRRAEAMLWSENRDPATVRGFFARQKPLTAKGKLALARALLAQGDRAGAAHHVRDAWTDGGVSNDVEKQATETFGDLITAADHRARMHARFYNDDNDTGLRIAARLGGADVAIARARNAVNEKASNAGALLEAVPGSARSDAGYIFSRIQHLRRDDKITEAGRLMLHAPRDPNQLVDLDEWWVERRLVARELLDIGDAHTAYRVAAEAVVPTKEHYRAEHHFTAGWIALRFLDKAQTALTHFERITHGTSNPITLARAFYWQGRAAEAAGHSQQARQHYAAAARYPTAYYGQIARAKLGMTDLVLRAPELSSLQRASLMQTELMRAGQLLYAADAKTELLAFMADLGDKTSDAGLVTLLAELAIKHKDARAALLVAKPALSRGLPVDPHAFPTIGIPDFKLLGEPVDKAIVYAISRQESAFNPRAVSVAKAMGLMQVMPGTGKMIAKRLGIGFDQKRLLNDPVYNAQLGADELANLIQGNRGSLILTFVGYNAGPGRAKQWIQRYGDPRDPAVDPIDWIERIPFSETRNYVQRVLENVQVYRVRLGHGSKLMVEADLRRGQN
jgi:soluble lytic murein transglycosylase